MSLFNIVTEGIKEIALVYEFVAEQIQRKKLNRVMVNLLQKILQRRPWGYTNKYGNKPIKFLKYAIIPIKLFLS